MFGKSDFYQKEIQFVSKTQEGLKGVGMTMEGLNGNDFIRDWIFTISY